MMNREQALAIQTCVVQWARLRPDIRGAALVGSWTRGEARPDSDLDVLLLTTDPNAYRRSTKWLTELDLITDTWRDVEYSSNWARQVSLSNGVEVELLIAGLDWANATPLDPGAVYVIHTGCQIWHDLDGRLARLVEAIG